MFKPSVPAAQASSRALAAHYGLTPKTVLKWRTREDTADAQMGPKPRSTTLTEAEEAIVVEFRRRILLPLDDVLGCLKDQIPTLTRSAVCDEHGIEHRLTKPCHPWTDGQAERMNRTVKDATTKAFHCNTAEGRRAHGLAFVSAYNFAKHLKALRWRTPFQAICDAWKADLSVFKINPHHLIPGPHT